MDLRDALSQISEIRQRMANERTFRGFRATPAAISGVLAIVAAAIQPSLIPQPQQDIWRYLALWSGVALLSVVGHAAGIILRLQRTRDPLERQATLLAIGQFGPCLIAGLLVTVAVVEFAQAEACMLPGLWCVLFSLGVFASRRMLPPAVFWVGAHYLLAGVVVLARAQSEAAFSPWAMGVPFGFGQLLGAAILYWNLERPHAQQA